MFQQQLVFQGAAPQPDSPGLKGRIAKITTKAAEQPKHVFNTIVSALPQELYIGQRLEFEVAINPDIINASSTEELPEVSLDACTITLFCQTNGPHPEHIEVLRQKVNKQRPSGPFSADTGFRKTVDGGTFGHMPSTFNFRNVSQSYKLRLDLQFYAAGSTVAMKKELPVIVYPYRAPREDDSLPSYEEVMGGHSRSASVV
ncbi:hypothetical protein CLAFUW4_06343 [Fulvia fulva]|uniref:Uncharacterized protein n=1 Tax=Passalora fulva TaxID=5499 RepID=A0A9Q8P923_PASFU|nr:uncharacterized protein CLAFUR5_06487 [Fulvia fulva]KAK4623568.1 hypothetical protein CLAFUR4_06346 [Fulvia fulva]KAK4625776.1 hypothetical protein CLAFUR0_06348 [Fulvia fulva]UJO17506.1 hypothetical protein CLAFUR5_06487 [Fulvia fulva]WPV15121.1 hypothetical protein CLAFUW4_06343 [Fulvia fulva]WPV30321.1 hypothetical protein CLAFUW7_06341 [Fulvia fulva]